MLYIEFVWLQLAAGAVQVGLAMYVRRVRDVPAVRPFSILMGLAALWAFVYALDISTASLPLKVFLMNLRIAFTGFLPLVILWLVLEYIGQPAWLTRHRLVLLLILPVLSALLTWGNNYHSLYRYNFRLDLSGPFPLLLWDGGPLQWIMQLYAAAVELGALWILLRSFRLRALYLQNTLVLILGILIPSLINLLYNLGITPLRGFNPASTTGVITSVLLAWALLRFRLFGVAPVARDVVMDAIDDLVFILDTDNHLVDFNHAAEVACGLSARSGGITPDALPLAWARLFQRYPDLSTGKEQVTLNGSEGHQVYDLAVSLVHDARHHVLGRLFLLHDVTERRQAEEIMHLRLRLLEFAANHSLPELMQQTLDEIGQITHSPIGFYHFVEADQKTISLQAWSTRTRQEFCTAEGTGLHDNLDQAGVWVDCVHQCQPVIHNDYPALPHRKGMPPGHAELKRELVVPTMRQGRIVSILGVGNKPVEYNHKDVEMVAYVADIVWTIVERKRVEAMLHESEERHRTLFETTVQGIVYQDAEGHITSANPAAQEILGLTLDQMQGRTSLDARWNSICEDGSEFPGDTHPSMVALRTGQEVRNVVMGVFNPRHGAHVWINISAIPQFRPGADAPWRVFTTFEDITARKQAEEALRNYAGQLAAQNAELDAFAHTVAHDLKSPLAIMIGFAGVLADDLDTMSPQDASRSAHTILRIGQRLAKIVDELMLLAGIRQQEVTPEPLDMGAAVQEAIDQLQPLIRDRQARITVLDGSAWPVALGYAPWIEQVWGNYISNAIKYGGQPPQVQIGAERVDPSGLYDIDMARFWIQDNGPGLDAEAQARLFTPFTRLGQAHIHGHGLGLSIVRRIVEKLGGQVGLESQPGQGSKFFFTLPLDKQAPTKA